MQSSILEQHQSEQLSNMQSSRKQSDSRVQPKRQEWAIIYNQQAQQFKRAKEYEKIDRKQKIEKLKHDLDQQLEIKSSIHQNQRQQQKRYSEFIRSKANEQIQKMRQQKLQRILQYRRVGLENVHLMQSSKNNQSRIEDSNSLSGLDIGEKPKIQRRKETYIRRKELTDALDKQLQIKQQQKRAQKQKQYLRDEQNMRYLQQFELRRNGSGGRKSQNQDVYKILQRINMERMVKERQQQKKLVQQVKMEKQIEESRKEQQKRRKKQEYENNVKKVLEDQIKYKSEQNLKQKKYNPEENSYQILGGIFKDRKVYDKKKYFEDLARQAEQQSLKKKKWNFMNDEEYLLNMNQLNKAVTGRYAHDYYIDRSINMVGQNRNKNSTMSIDNGNRSRSVNYQQDVIKVKQKIDQMKRQKEQILRNNESYHF